MTVPKYALGSRVRVLEGCRSADIRGLIGVITDPTPHLRGINGWEDLYWKRETTGAGTEYLVYWVEFEGRTPPNGVRTTGGEVEEIWLESA